MSSLKILYRTGGVLLLAGLAACSSSPTREELQEESMRIDAMREEAREKRIEVENEKLEAKLEVVPDWYLKAPPSDGVGVYGVGQGVSTRLDNAVKIAQLQSEYDVARQLKQEISGQEREYNKQTGESDIVYQYSQLVDKLVSRVPVVGFDVIEKEVHVMDGKYHAYVLLKLPFREFNKVMQQESAQNQDATVKAAFDDLEERINTREAQRRNEGSAPAPLQAPQGSANGAPAAVQESPGTTQLDLNQRVISSFGTAQP